MGAGIAPRDIPALSASTLCEAFQVTAAERASSVAIRLRGDAVAADVESSTRAASRGIAGGLSRLGVERGEAVAIMLTNRPEFHLVDCAAMHLGAVPFSLYNAAAREQLAQILRDSGARILITETEVRRDRRGPPGRCRPPPRASSSTPPGPDSLVELRERRARARLRRALARGAAGGSGDADLHLRHHRSAQVRPGDPPRTAGRVGGPAPGLRHHPRRPHPVLAAGRAHRRPPARPVPADLLRPHDHLRPRHQGTRRASGRRQAHLLGRGARASTRSSAPLCSPASHRSSTRRWRSDCASGRGARR